MSEDFAESYQTRYGERPQFASEHSNEVIMGLMQHRSHRAFNGRAVPESLMKTLFASAFSAPSKSDLQQASVVRLSDSRQREALAEVDPGLRGLLNAPEFLVWCGDSRRIRLLGDERQNTFANDHLDAFMNAAVDAGIVMQNFIVAAESVGLGCCPVSQVRNNVLHLSKILALPKWVFPVAGMALGWPAKPGHVSMRLPNRITVHENRYDDSSLMDEVNQYDARRENAQPTPDSAQLRSDLFGVKPNYGWSEHRSRQYAIPQRTDFGEYIRQQGFDLS